MKIIFFDTETTGNTENDRIVQLAIKERGVATPILNELFQPPFPIPFESSAVHHISNKMVMSKPTFQESAPYEVIKSLFEDPETIAVAHNAAFDVAMLIKENIHPSHTICTYKTVRTLDTTGEFTNHKLQYLRYALAIELDVGAHDAFADVLVLEQLFEYLLKKMIDTGLSETEALEKMKTISNEPTLVKDFSFGKYKGKTIVEVAALDPGYLQWLLGEKKKNPTGEEDWIYTLEKYLLQ